MQVRLKNIFSSFVQNHRLRILWPSSQNHPWHRNIFGLFFRFLNYNWKIIKRNWKERKHNIFSQIFRPQKGIASSHYRVAKELRWREKIIKWRNYNYIFFQRDNKSIWVLDGSSSKKNSNATLCLDTFSEEDKVSSIGKT